MSIHRWFGRATLTLALFAGCSQRTSQPAVTNATPPAASPTPAPPPSLPPSSLPPSKSAFYADTFSRKPSANELRATGRALFAATALSGDGTLSCRSCHDPGHAYGPGAPVQLPAAHYDGAVIGTRAVPSLRYLQSVPVFNEHFQDSDGDGTDQGPAGGFMWDGRAASAHEQALLPLFSPTEMNGGDAEALRTRLRAAPVAQLMRDTFGADVLDQAPATLKAVARALEVYQQTRDFAPYDSKYDSYLRHRATLSAAEQRGLVLFEDPRKGNCMSCHPSRLKEGGFPTFTDFGFNALGIPRNRALAANRDPRFFDLGLCGPLRKDLSARPEFCGLFRTPSLRNVATRRRLFHNGAVGSLRDAVRFYVERDVAPRKWYPSGAWDDAPPAARANVNQLPPFGRKRATLTAKEIDDVVAFLGTLNDGYVPPPNAPAPNAPSPNAP